MYACINAHRKNMGTSSIAYELNHECVSTQTSTHVIQCALIHGYICFISYSTLSNFPNIYQLCQIIKKRTVLLKCQNFQVICLWYTWMFITNNLWIITFAFHASDKKLHSDQLVRYLTLLYDMQTFGICDVRPYCVLMRLDRSCVCDEMGTLIS